MSLVSVSKVPEKSRKLARWWNGNTFILILLHWQESVKVEVACVRPFGGRLDGAGSRLATGMFVGHFASFSADPGGTPCCQNACCPCTSVVHNPPIGSMNHFEGVKRGVDGRMSAVGISPHRSTADTLGGPFDPSTSRGAPGYPRSMHEVIGGGFGSAVAELAANCTVTPTTNCYIIRVLWGRILMCLVVFDSTSALSPHSALAVLCTPFPRILLDGLSQTHGFDWVEVAWSAVV
ncbi:hypothetical protein F5141DRAFT_1219522 [Pisolithus sp. B1]|nr:hypothetical protein F5141DRAFT_1219522 [Pisolithus sp. B1]